MTDRPVAVGSPRRPVRADRIAPRARRTRHRFLRWDVNHGRPEIYITSERLARAIAATIASFVALATVLWAVQARQRLGVAEVVRPLWFRLPQFGLAVVGIALAAAEVVYLTYFALTGTVWRHWRGLTLGFGLVSAAWTAIWLLDRFALDAVFVR